MPYFNLLLSIFYILLLPTSPQSPSYNKMRQSKIKNLFIHMDYNISSLEKTIVEPSLVRPDKSFSIFENVLKRLSNHLTVPKSERFTLKDSGKIETYFNFHYPNKNRINLPSFSFLLTSINSDLINKKHPLYNYSTIIIDLNDLHDLIDPNAPEIMKTNFLKTIPCKGGMSHWNLIRQFAENHLICSQKRQLYIMNINFIHREKQESLSESHLTYNIMNNISNPSMSFNNVLRNGMTEVIKKASLLSYKKLSRDQKMSNNEDDLRTHFLEIHGLIGNAAANCDYLDNLFFIVSELLNNKEQNFSREKVCQIINNMKHNVNSHHDLQFLKTRFKIDQINNLEFDKLKFSVWTSITQMTQPPDKELGTKSANEAHKIFEQLNRNDKINAMIKDILFIRRLYMLIFFSECNSLKSNLINSFSSTFYDFHHSCIDRDFFPFYSRRHASSKAKKDPDETFLEDTTHECFKLSSIKNQDVKVFSTSNKMYIIDTKTHQIEMFTKDDLCYLANLYETFLVQLVNSETDKILHENSTSSPELIDYLQNYIFHQGPIKDPEYFKNFGKIEELHIALMSHLSRTLPGSLLNHDGDYVKSEEPIKSAFPSANSAFTYFDKELSKESLSGNGFAFEQTVLGDCEHYLDLESHDKIIKSELINLKNITNNNLGTLVENILSSDHKIRTVLKLNQEIINNEFLLMHVINGFLLIQENASRYSIKHENMIESVELKLRFDITYLDGSTESKMIQKASEIADLPNIREININNQWRFTNSDVKDMVYFVHEPFQKFLKKINTLIEPLIIRFQCRRIGGHPVVSSAPILRTLESRIQKDRPNSQGLDSLIAQGFTLRCLNYYVKNYGSWPRIKSFNHQNVPESACNTHEFKILMDLYKYTIAPQNNLKPSAIILNDSLKLRIILYHIRFDDFLSSEIKQEFMIDALSKDTRICEDAVQTANRFHRDCTKRISPKVLKTYCNIRRRCGDLPGSFFDREKFNHGIDRDPGIEMPFNVLPEDKINYLRQSGWNNLADIEHVAKMAVQQKIAFLCKLNEKERELKENARAFASLDGLSTVILQGANRLMFQISKLICPYVKSGKSKKDISQSIKDDLMNESSTHEKVVFNLSTDISKFCTSLRASDMEEICDVVKTIFGSTLPRDANRMFKQHFVIVNDPTLSPEINLKEFSHFVGNSKKIGPQSDNDFIEYKKASDKFISSLEEGNTQERKDAIDNWLLKHKLTCKEFESFITGKNLLCYPQGFFEGLFQSLWTVWLCEVQDFSRLVIKMEGNQVGSGDNQRTTLEQNLSWCHHASGQPITTQPFSSANKVGNLIKGILESRGITVKGEESLLQASASFFIKKLCIGNKYYMSSTPESLRQSLFDTDRDPNILKNMSAASMDLSHRLHISHNPYGEMYNHAITTEIFANVNLIHHHLSNNSYDIPLRETPSMSIFANKASILLKNDCQLNLNIKDLHKINQNMFSFGDFEVSITKSKKDRKLQKEELYKRYINKSKDWVVIFLMQSIPLTVSNLQGSTNPNGPFDHNEQRTQNCIEALNRVIEWTNFPENVDIKTAINGIINLPIIVDLQSCATVRQTDILESLTPRNANWLSKNITSYIIEYLATRKKLTIYESSNDVMSSDLDKVNQLIIRKTSLHAPIIGSAINGVAMGDEALNQLTTYSTRTSFQKTTATANRKTFEFSAETRYRKEAIFEKERQQRRQRDDDSDDCDVDALSDHNDSDEYDDEEIRPIAKKTKLQEFLDQKTLMPNRMINIIQSSAAVFKVLFCVPGLPNYIYDPTKLPELLEEIQKKILGNEGKRSLVPTSTAYSNFASVKMYKTRAERDEMLLKSSADPNILGLIRMEAHCDSFGPLYRITSDCALWYNNYGRFIQTIGAQLDPNSKAAQFLNNIMQNYAFAILATSPEDREQMGKLLSTISGLAKITPDLLREVYGQAAHRTGDVLYSQNLAFPPTENNSWSCDTRDVKDIDEFGNKLRFDIQSVLTYLLEIVRRNPALQHSRPPIIFLLGEITKNPGPPSLLEKSTKIDFNAFKHLNLNEIGKASRKLFEALTSVDTLKFTYKKHSLIPSNLQHGSLVQDTTLFELNVWGMINVFLMNLSSNKFQHGIGVSNLKYFNFDLYLHLIKSVTIIRFFHSIASAKRQVTRMDVKRKILFEHLNQICKSSKNLLKTYSSVAFDLFHKTEENIDRRSLKGLLHQNTLEYLVFTMYKNEFDNALKEIGSEISFPFLQRGFLFYPLISKLEDIQILYFLFNGIPQSIELYRRVSLKIQANHAYLIENQRHGKESSLHDIYELISCKLKNFDFSCHTLEGIDVKWAQFNSDRFNQSLELVNQYSLPLLYHAKAGFKSIIFDSKKSVSVDCQVKIYRGLRTYLTEITGENSATPIFVEFIASIIRFNIKCVIILGSGLGFLGKRLQDLLSDSVVLFVSVDLNNPINSQEGHTRTDEDNWVEIQGDCTKGSTFDVIQRIIAKKGKTTDLKSTLIVLDVEEQLRTCTPNTHVVTKTLDVLTRSTLQGKIVFKTKGSNLHSYLHAKYPAATFHRSNLAGASRVIFGNMNTNIKTISNFDHMAVEIIPVVDDIKLPNYLSQAPSAMKTHLLMKSLVYLNISYNIRNDVEMLLHNNETESEGIIFKKILEFLIGRARNFIKHSLKRSHEDRSRIILISSLLKYINHRQGRHSQNRSVTCAIDEFGYYSYNLSDEKRGVDESKHIWEHSTSLSHLFAIISPNRNTLQIAFNMLLKKYVPITGGAAFTHYMKKEILTNLKTLLKANIAFQNEIPESNRVTLESI